MHEQQIREIEERMQEEHQKDIEALKRLKRFLPDETEREEMPAPNASRPVLVPLAEGGKSKRSQPSTIRGNIEGLFRNNPDEQWTVRRMKRQLEVIGIQSKAKNPIASIGSVFQRLLMQSKIQVVVRGHGNEPNLYQAVSGDEDVGTAQQPTANDSATAVEDEPVRG